MADKDPEGMLSLLEPVLAEVVITRASNTRALEVDDLAEVAIDIFGEDRVHVAERLNDALDLAVARAESEVERGCRRARHRLDPARGRGAAAARSPLTPGHPSG